MPFTEIISKVFKNQFRLEFSEEKFDSAEFRFSSSGLSTPTDDDINSLISSIIPPDTFTIHLKVGTSNEITFQSGNDVGDFRLQINSQLQFYNQGDTSALKIAIRKRSGNEDISIYSLSSFTNYLKVLKLEDILITFSECISQKVPLIFRCNGIAKPFSSENILFLPRTFNNIINSTELNEREERLTKIASNCSLNISSPIIVLPNDFFTRDKNTDFEELNVLLNKTCSCLLIASLFDSITIKEDQVSYKLNGYRSFVGNVEMTAPLKSIEEYYKIYQWVYSGGSLADKMGLARNIISLNLVSSSNPEINKNTYESLLSAHKVYEKQNIKQYIELRNKVTDQVYAFNERANKIIESFASGFQKSALAFVTLFSTIVITRVLTTKEFNNIFSYDSTIISLLFLTGSLIYFFISLWEVNAQLQRFIKSYSNMKERNEDLLLKDDINKILKNDQENADDLSFIRRKRNLYSILWISFLTLFLGATLYLHYEYGKLKPNEKNLLPKSVISKIDNNNKDTSNSKLIQPIKLKDSTANPLAK